MAVLPTFLLNVPSEYSSLNADQWITVVVGCIYAVADYVGRQVVVIRMRMQSVLALTVIRIACIPIAILFYKSVVVNEAALYIFTLLFGLSHGQISCFTFMEYTGLLAVEEQETGTVIMQFWLVAGTAVSGLLSWALEMCVRI